MSPSTYRASPPPKRVALVRSLDSFRHWVTRWGWLFAIAIPLLIIIFVQPTQPVMVASWVFLGIGLIAMAARLVMHLIWRIWG